MERTTPPQIDFIGIGVNKCGTTWVNACLNEHPEICTSRPKETHYFSHKHGNGIDWYRSCFFHCSDEKLRGEYSPEYIDKDEAIDRIAKHYPHAKLLVIIREPLDRLRSSWRFNYFRGVHNYTAFEDYVASAPTNIWQKGLYATRLQYVYKYFSPEQVHVMLFDDIHHRPQLMLEKLYKFLGVKNDFIPTIVSSQINASGTFYPRLRLMNNLIYRLRLLKRKHRLFKVLTSWFRKLGGIKLVKRLELLNRTRKQPAVTLNDHLSAATKARVISYYEEDIQQLETLTGITIPAHWFHDQSPPD